MVSSIFLALFITMFFTAWAVVFRRGRYFQLLMVGFIVRAVLILVHERTRMFGDYDISDYLRYLEGFSWSLYDGSLGEYFGTHVPAYVMMYPGWIYELTGYDGLWVIRLANAAVALLVIWPLTRITESLWGTSLTRFQAGLVIFWPSWMRFNIEIGRSAPSVFFVLVGVAGLLLLLRTRRADYGFLALVGVVVGTLLRTPYIIYFAPLLAFLGWQAVTRVRNPSLRLLGYLVAPLVALIITLGVFNTFHNVTPDYYQVDSTDAITQLAMKRDKGGSAYLSGVYANSVVDYSWYVPLHGFYFMFSPMPWQVRHAFLAGSSLQAILVLYLLFAGWRRGRRRGLLNRPTRLLFMTLLIVALGMGVVTKNAGSAERWRLPSTLILLVVSTSLLRRDDVVRYGREPVPAMRPVKPPEPRRTGSGVHSR